MSDRQQDFEQNYEKVGTIPTDQSYPTSPGTSTNVGVNREVNLPTTTTIKPQPQPQVRTPNKDMSPILPRLLMGGLIGAGLGATLGTLAGAFAGKRTSEGVNRAAKGVGNAAKTIAEGVTQTAKGVGDAAKSVADGINYAVVGSLQDTAEGVNRSVGAAFEAVKGTAKDTAEGVSNVVEGALETVQDTAENAKQSAVGVADAVKDTAENAKQSAVGTLDKVQDTAESIKPSDNLELKVASQRRVADAAPMVTDDVSMGEQDKSSMTYISGPDGTMAVEASMPVIYGESDYEDRQVSENEIYRESAGI
jgi:gas vesicle protein